MTKQEYLKYVMETHIYEQMSWVCTAFADTRPVPTDFDASQSPAGTLVKTQWGYSFSYHTDIGVVLEPISSTSSGDEGLFNFLDVIEVSPTWLPNIGTVFKTTIGNLLVNAIALVPAFGAKIPFITGKFSINSIERLIAPRLISTPPALQPRDPSMFYVDEYLMFGKALNYLKGFSRLSCWAATRKNVVAAPGSREYKETLLKEYEGQLSDPVKLAEFEDRLLAYDDAYLKDDPTYGAFMSGKVKNVCRKKMYLSLGAETTFEDKSKVDSIINSLDEGWPQDPKQLVAMMNGTRIGSYSRGVSTIKGGMAAKILLRASDNFRILDLDCGTRLGIRRHIETSSADKLIGRYVISSGVSTLVTTDTYRQYIDSDIVVRSPMYCKSEGANICRYCAGENLNRYPTGLSLAVAEISNTLLYAFFGAMHAKRLEVTKLDLNKMLT